MDADIKNEFAAVRADLRNVDARVREVDSLVGEVEGQVREVDTRLSTEIRREETTIRQEIREEGIATRRHFDVVAGSLRDDIRIIAESEHRAGREGRDDPRFRMTVTRAVGGRRPVKTRRWPVAGCLCE